MNASVNHQLPDNWESGRITGNGPMVVKVINLDTFFTAASRTLVLRMHVINDAGKTAYTYISCKKNEEFAHLLFSLLKHQMETEGLHVTITVRLDRIGFIKFVPPTKVEEEKGKCNAIHEQN